jgi:hypothetical protein
MRKQLLGLMVPLMAFVLIAAAADTTGKGVAASARLQTLEVAHGQDGLRVEFKATGTLAPKVSTLESPARIVIDLPNTVMATAQSHINVGRDGVKDVRVGHGRASSAQYPRRHLDLASSRQHELVSGPDGSFILKIHDAELAHRPSHGAGQGSGRDGYAETGTGIGSGSFSSGNLGARDPGSDDPSGAGPGLGGEPGKPADLPSLSPSTRSKLPRLTTRSPPSPSQRRRKRRAVLPTRQRRNWSRPTAMPPWGKQVATPCRCSRP